MQDLTGQTIKGYQLREQIGSGGFGAVYVAYQAAVQREVAVKVILPTFANQPEFIRSFEKEARLIAHLEHPFIVPLYDFWRDPEGGYLVMRFLPRNLADHIERSGPYTPDEALHLLDDLTGALTVAHRNHVVHRDIKPENILLDNDGNAYLTDFGISITLDDDKQASSQPGFTGSFEYTSPEIFRGQTPSIQSDIYSLGYVLHRMLTGEKPLESPSLTSWINHHLSEAIPPHPRIPASVQTVLQKACAKEPEQRYTSVVELANDFRVAVSGKRVKTSELAPQAVISPYKGLRAFEETDAHDFFGREALTDQLITRLRESGNYHRFLAVVGPSGSGKSSAVKAGLRPALREGRLPGSDQWFLTEMIPSDYPLEKLATALLGIAVAPPPDLLEQLQASENGLANAIDKLLPAEQEALLIIDQFEELFTSAVNETERAHFLESLYQAVSTPASRLRVIITLRADFYDRPLVYEHFAAMMRLRTEVVIPLTTQELEQAITGPAERAGLAVDSNLVSAIVADLRNEPGTLPLLQYALTEAFARRAGSTLSLESYRASGGALQALAHRAEEIYIGLPDDQQEMVRQISLRLITLGEGTEDTRRRALVSELFAIVPDRNALQSILDLFGKYRLFTFDHDPKTREPSVEIAHEAFIREWARLKTWLEQSRDDVRLQRILAESCQEWIQSRRSTDFLLTGGRLTQFEEWADKSNIALTTNEEAFLQAGIRERDRLIALETERQAHERDLERRAGQRLRVLAAVLTVGATVAMLLAAIAFQQSNNAQSARKESEQNAEISSETSLLSNALLTLYRDNNTDLAIALALEAINLNNLAEKDYQVLSEAIYAPGTRRLYTGHTDAVQRIDLNDDGTLVISGSNDGTLRLWDVQTGETLHVYEAHTATIHDVRFSPDERLLASAAGDGPGTENAVRIWDIQTGEVLLTIDGDEYMFLGIDFSPSGDRIATASANSIVAEWDLETGELIRAFGPDDPDTEEREGHRDAANSVVYSPDGTYLLSSGGEPYNGVAILRDAETGEIVHILQHPRIVYNAVFTRDGTRILTGMLDNFVRMWDVKTGEHTLTFSGHTAAIFAMSTSPDEKTLLTASQDKSIRMWNMETGAEIHQFMGHQDRVKDIRFLPNGTQFISSSDDHTLRLWDIVTDDTLQQITGPDGSVFFVKYNTDGTLIVSASRDKTMGLWDAQSGELLQIFTLEDPDAPTSDDDTGHWVMGADFSPDETRLLSGEYGTTAHIWDIETGEILLSLEPDDPTTEEIEGHDISQPIWCVAYSTDGKSVFTGGFDGAIIQWDAATGEIIHRFLGHNLGITHIEVTRDAKRILTSSWDSTAILWDVATGEILHHYDAHTDWLWTVTLSPDDTTFLTTSADNTMVLWDIESETPIRRFVGHSDSVLSADYSPDGKFAVSAGRDYLVILWNLENGEMMRRFADSRDWVRSIDYNPNGSFIAAGDNLGTIRIWHVQTLDEMVEWAMLNRYVRDLTCEEREIYRVPPLCSSP